MTPSFLGVILCGAEKNTTKSPENPGQSRKISVYVFFLSLPQRGDLTDGCAGQWMYRWARETSTMWQSGALTLKLCTVCPF